MGNVYVISDLHGKGDAFFKMLDQIDFSMKDEMYIIGDVVDRGPDGISLLQYIQKQTNMELLMGNHEDMMIKSCSLVTKLMWMDTWMFNGGRTTLDGLEQLSKEERKACLEYVKGLPLYKTLEVGGIQYLLVHAGIQMISGKLRDDLLKVDGEEALWIRKDFFDSPVIPKYYIIFGHTPTGAMVHYARTLPAVEVEKARMFHIVRWNHRIGIDCGAAYGENLGCLRLNDQKEFYVNV